MKRKNTNLHAYDRLVDPTPESQAFEQAFAEPPVIAPPILPAAEKPPIRRQPPKPAAPPRPRPTVGNNYNAALGRTWVDWLQFAADILGSWRNPTLTRLRFEQEQANQEQLDK